jgi:succinoglycan biosynthesis protein ExoL
MRIAYLVHNLADPAVAKRVRMLAAGGDTVQVVGFHRDAPVARIEDIDAIDLGRTFDANFAHRFAMVSARLINLGWAKALAGCDVLMARNLEMLVLAAALRRRYAPQASLVYECLDIHRLLLDGGVAGAAMRALERRMLRRIDLLVVSSPAFLHNYFEPRYRTERDPPALIVENKFAPPSGLDVRPSLPTGIAAGPPWHIGWFGMIRCRKSLDLLCDLASRRPDLLRVTIRGRPSYTEFDDFDGQVAGTAGVSFGGSYRAEELAALYRSVHFNWAIDYFEEGANSHWLLPNRIYEGGAFRAVPIALPDTETARWLARRGLGVALDPVTALEAFLAALTAERYAALRAASEAVPLEDFVADRSDCQRLRDALAHSRLRRSKSARRRSVELDLGPTGEARDDAAM